MASSTYEILVAEGSRSNDIVIIRKDGVHVADNRVFAQAFKFCVSTMLPDDNLKLGNQVFSQQVVTMLDVAVKGGLAELQNPLPQPEIIERTYNRAAPTLTETDVPASLRRSWPATTTVHAYAYNNWDNRPCVIIALGNLDELSARFIRSYYSNDGGNHWEEDTAGPWNEGYNQYVRMVKEHLAQPTTDAK